MSTAAGAGRSATLHIEGMNCSHCVETVDRTLKKIQGASVHSVVIGQALIEVSDEESLKGCISAIERAGFHVSAVK